MKKSGILNKEISTVIASMGHTDMLTISDCGLPIAPDRYRIDLSIIGGKPSFLEVLEPIVDELKIEKAIMSEEIKLASPKMLDAILKVLPKDIEIEYVPHIKFKEISNSKTKGVIRTGEMTPYANVILVSGVTY